MRERRRHSHLRILFMDFRSFWERFILGRVPDRRYSASAATGSGRVKAWKPR